MKIYNSSLRLCFARIKLPKRGLIEEKKCIVKPGYSGFIRLPKLFRYFEESSTSNEVLLI